MVPIDAFRLAEWTVVPSENLLTTASEQKRLESKVMQLLATLSASQGDVLKKEVLLAQVWPGQVVVEGVLKRGISELRKALNDSVDHPRFIETIPGVGYRLLHPVEAVPDVAPDRRSVSAVGRSRRTTMVAGVVTLLILVLVVWWMTAQSNPNPSPDQRAQARELYIHGKHLWASRTGTAIRESIRYFDEALKIDPTFNEALAAKGSAYVILSNYSGMNESDAFKLARQYTEAALKADPTMGEATAVLANLESGAGDQVRALELYQRAIELDPISAPAHQWYGGFLVMMGYIDEGSEMLGRAHALDPLSGSTNTGMLLVAAIQQDDDALTRHSETARSVGAVRAGLFYAVQALRKGELEKAIIFAETSYLGRGWSADHIRIVFTAYLDPANRSSAHDALLAIEPAIRANQEHFYFEWVLLGDIEQALVALKSIKPPLLSAKLWLPENLGLHQHPEFIRVLRNHHGYGALWASKGRPDICVKHVNVMCE